MEIHGNNLEAMEPIRGAGIKLNYDTYIKKMNTVVPRKPDTLVGVGVIQ